MADRNDCLTLTTVQTRLRFAALLNPSTTDGESGVLTKAQGEIESLALDKRTTACGRGCMVKRNIEAYSVGRLRR